ncbi:hypothetical protein T12_15584 [Trichinella patagoniensis]|uniref:Uncharacterized protein n=1 Tax=Trichinella patagoniensis TaxID=990121 RepID=A0A0V0YR49_9BILA|nr:hypothetical protein T12_15584 [Trichinella patagoniensis]
MSDSILKPGKQLKSHLSALTSVMLPLSMAREIKLPEELTERSWKRY